MTRCPADVEPQQEARPYWLGGPCPAWCTGRHRNTDQNEDRLHTGRTVQIVLTLADPQRIDIDSPEGREARREEYRLDNPEPDEIGVGLYQHYRATEPEVRINVASEPREHSLALAEAFELVTALTVLLEDAGYQPQAGAR